MNDSSNVLQTLVTAVAMGTLLLVVAGKLRVPAIAPLLLGGFVLGPNVLGIVHPASLGPVLEPFISLAIAVILFEGGLTLDLHSATQAPRVIWRLVTVGALITWFATAAMANWLLRLSIREALLAGGLLIVTGPTVVTPLLRRVKVSERVHSILHWEAVLIDPIGVFVALLCYESIGIKSTFAAAFGLFIIRLGAGLALGLGGGLVASRMLKHRVIPPEYVNIATLAWALLIYGVADTILPHTGILAVTVAGFVLGWQSPTDLDELKTFKLQMTELAVAAVFVLLAAELRPMQFARLGGEGIVFVLLVIFLVRPLNVFVSTWGSHISLRERLFVAWIAPRGIVAASMASLFALELSASGSSRGAIVGPLTFLVIAATVLLQGTTAGTVARVLGVQRPTKRAWLVVNGRRLGRRLSKLLSEQDVPSILIDRNAAVVREAQQEGHQAFLADALDGDLPNDPRLVQVGYVLAATDNDAVNTLAVRRWAQELGDGAAYKWQHLGNRSDPSASTSVHAMARAQSVNRGLASGEMEMVLLKPSEVGPDDDTVRPIICLRDGQALPLASPKSNPEYPRIALRWTRPDAHEIFQSVTFLDPPPTDLSSAYATLAQVATAYLPGLDERLLVSGIVERARSMSVHIGHGVAIPHAYSSATERPLCIVGIVREGIALPSTLNETRVRVIFLLISPKNAAEEHLSALADIAHWSADPKRVDDLLQTASHEEALGKLIAHIRRSETPA